jgi:hypothetical protein
MHQEMELDLGPKGFLIFPFPNVDPGTSLKKKVHRLGTYLASSMEACGLPDSSCAQGDQICKTRR